MENIEACAKAHGQIWSGRLQVILCISERLRLSLSHHAYGSAARPFWPQIKDGVILECLHFQPFQHFQCRTQSFNQSSERVPKSNTGKYKERGYSDPKNIHESSWSNRRIPRGKVFVFEVENCFSMGVRRYLALKRAFFLFSLKSKKHNFGDREHNFKKVP